MGEAIIITIVLGGIFIVVLYILQNTIRKKDIENKEEREELKERNNTLQNDQTILIKQKEVLIRDNAELRAQLDAKEELLSSQQRELQEMREKLNKDFQVLANQILEEKTERFTSMNKLNMEAILKPLSERLGEFKVKVEETYDKESKQRFSLEERIKELVALNSQISEDANNLTKALKGK